ncbi:MAG: antitoxin CptB [Halieaceae bacterium]|jgi:antitoxin CptB
MSEDSAYKRLCWHSRRGMLELDLMLGPFVKERYLELSVLDQNRYRDLLVCEDQDLFRWLLGLEQADNAEIAAIVEKIIQYARART